MDDAALAIAYAFEQFETSVVRRFRASKAICLHRKSFPVGGSLDGSVIEYECLDCGHRQTNKPTFIGVDHGR